MSSAYDAKNFLQIAVAQKWEGGERTFRFASAQDSEQICYSIGVIKKLFTSCVAEDVWQLSSAYDAKNSSASCVAEDAWQLSSAQDSEQICYSIGVIKKLFASCVVEDAWRLSSAYDVKNFLQIAVAQKWEGGGRTFRFASAQDSEQIRYLIGVIKKLFASCIAEDAWQLSSVYDAKNFLQIAVAQKWEGGGEDVPFCVCAG